MSAFEHTRRHVLKLTVGADDFEEMARALEDFALSLRQGERTGPIGMSAGWASSYVYSHVFNEEMTGDRFRELLEEWFDKERESRK